MIVNPTLLEIVSTHELRDKLTVTERAELLFNINEMSPTAYTPTNQFKEMEAIIRTHDEK